MSDPFTGLDFPKPGSGAYASADDLLLVADLCEIDLVVKRWKRNGAPLRIRVRALDFEQQERIDRAALVKVEERYVRSEARFAAATLREALIVPTLTDAQARQMVKHNPAIIAQVVRFVWDVLSGLDQDAIDAIVESEIPDASSAGDHAAADADSGDEPTAVPTLGPAYGFESAGVAPLAQERDRAPASRSDRRPGLARRAPVRRRPRDAARS